MANKEDHHPPPPPPRGNEWEVVSLTSSAYAASPGPYNFDSRDAARNQHEDLPLDDDDDEPVLQEVGSKDEQSLYGDEPALGTSRQYVESVGSESAMYEHGLIDSEPNESAEGGLDVRSDTAEDTLGLEKDGKKARHDLPCEAWWRRRAVSIYIRTREANAMWSLFFAAAVTGLVVLGQRWQQERWQVLQLKWHSSISSEKLSRVLEPLSRLKGVIVRGNPQASLVRSGTSSEI
ncbi:hypothetical protein Bca4012_035264 [Brassica carinata]